jgi:SAM-dependent methyltransferase
MTHHLEAAETPDELPVRDGYAAWASSYDHDGNPLVPLEGPAVADLIGSVRGLLVLDVGCGTGRHALALSAAGATVVALDGSPEMLAIGRSKPGAERITWVRHSVPSPLPFADLMFDRAVLGLVAEHLEDLESTLIEVARVLVPGGLCVLSALHPDRTAEGQRARFLDPATGLRRPIRTVHRSRDDYHAAAHSAGLALQAERTLIVTPEHAALYPRAAKYLGLPLGWAAYWSRAVTPASTPLSSPLPAAGRA